MITNYSGTKLIMVVLLYYVYRQIKFGNQISYCLTSINNKMLWLLTKKFLYYFNSSADGNYEVRYKSNVLIYPNGEVLWVPPAIYQVRLIFFSFKVLNCNHDLLYRALVL